jgi:GNAT superfamily N-acetyltransferase
VRWSLGEGGDLVDRFTCCFAHFLEAVLGHGLVWEADGGRGAAVWVPPEQFADWEVHPWSHPSIAGLADDGRNYSRFWDWVDLHNPSEPLWQLDSLAVEPVSQGHGLGGALVATGQALARADGVGAFLSTGNLRSVTTYERLGFRVVQAAAVPNGGPEVYFMRWDP